MELPAGLLIALQSANKVLVVTGAGMSAESGVPTFRDAQQGLWSKYKPEDLATPEAFRKNPQFVWDWYEQRRSMISKVLPHAGHTALAELARHFKAFSVVTQNVDGLHQLAGSMDVTELHGNIMRSVCSRTGKWIDNELIIGSTVRPPVSPHHPQGLARPDVVWFGEALPEQNFNHATGLAGDCDVCLSIGTSNLVQPAASLPFLALNSGAVVAEINPIPTRLGQLAHFSIRSTAVDALTAIVGQFRVG